MTIKRFFKKCEEFTICSEIGDAGDYLFEESLDSMTMYHVLIKGRGRLGAPYEAEYLEEGPYVLIDAKKYLGKQRIYYGVEDFQIIGFNPLSKNHDWDGRLVTESFDGDSKSWLICFDGNPIVNGKELNRWNYAQLEDKHYDVIINDGCIGVFTKKFGPFTR